MALKKSGASTVPARTPVHPFTANAAQTTPLGTTTSSRPLDSPLLSPSARIDLLRGMLERLKDATPAGRHYLIAKVLPLLRREAFDPLRRSERTERQMIARS